MKTFIRIGQVLLFLSAVSLTTLVILAALDAAEKEEQARQDNLIAKGFILKMDNVKKRRPNLDNCVIKGERMFCEDREKGIQRITEVVK